MSDSWDISRQLAERRREVGLSLSQLAVRADTSAATLSRYESGWTRFEVYTLRKLATALGCQLVIRFEPKRRVSRGVSVADVVRRIGRLFWDQDLSARYLTEYPEWVVRRVLEYGNLADVAVLVRWLGKDGFLRIVSKLRFETDTTRRFWHQILHREGVPCTRESSHEEVSTS